MTTQEYQVKYAEIKRRLHCVVYGSKEYKQLQKLLTYYYMKGFAQEVCSK